MRRFRKVFLLVSLALSGSGVSQVAAAEIPAACPPGLHGKNVYATMNSLFERAVKSALEEIPNGAPDELKDAFARYLGCSSIRREGPPTTLGYSTQGCPPAAVRGLRGATIAQAPERASLALLYLPLSLKGYPEGYPDLRQRGVGHCDYRYLLVY
jgi:hypothetical protein